MLTGCCHCTMVILEQIKRAKMTNPDIAGQRLYNQHISKQIFTKPGELVKYMGAVQAQDYAGAKWAIGLRLQKSSDAAIDKAMADGSIIRTHVMRPTWHFVSPDDLRWMLDLTASRIHAFSASWYRKLQLDSVIFSRSNDALARAMEGGKQLNREEIKAVLEFAGIKTDDLRFVHLLMHAELDKVICSGGRQGKQFTYALFDERVPVGSKVPREEALGELAKRYFTSHGPATLQDFAWWSGLTLSDAKTGLDLAGNSLKGFESNGIKLWMKENGPDINIKTPVAYLLPAFDEFAVAYGDRTAAVNPEYLKQAKHVIFDPSILINNQVAGTWKRTINKNKIDMALNLFGEINSTQIKAIKVAAGRYKTFMNKEEINIAGAA